MTKFIFKTSTVFRRTSTEIYANILISVELLQKSELPLVSKHIKCLFKYYVTNINIQHTTGVILYYGKTITLKGKRKDVRVSKMYNKQNLPNRINLAHFISSMLCVILVLAEIGPP